MKQPSISCRQARQIDLVEYLASLYYHPQKVLGVDHWYLSPFRKEKTVSFKVNRRLNLWFDHGEGRGGDLIDFGTRYHRCTVSELLERLSRYSASPTFSFQQPLVSGPVGAGEKEEPTEGKILVLEVRSLATQSLIHYLQKRKIPMDIAASCCQEVNFSLYGKRHTAIGFPNRSGGFELRNEQFKGSSSPKDITLINNHTDEIVVFEGFFNYLSFQTINQDKQAPLTNCLVLNSLAFLERSRSLIEQYKRVHLALDRDEPGQKFTRMARQWDPDRYIDRSDFYQGHKDLNEWLQHPRPPFRQNHDRRMGRSL